MPNKKSNTNTPVPDFEAMADAVMNGLAKEVAKHAKHFFLDGFDKGGFTDVNFIPWVKRQDFEDHAVMSKTEALKNSIEIISATPERIEVGVNEALPYSDIHNTGGTITVTVTDKMRKFFWFVYISMTKGSAHISIPDHVLKWKKMALSKNETMTIHIPQRQYIGESYTLDQQIDKIVVSRILESVQQKQ